MSQTYELIIIGAGVAGSSLAYQLVHQNVENILLLDAGEIGRGTKSTYTIPPPQPVFETETSYSPYISGTALPPEASTAKMMVTLFPSTAQEFLRHHGESGVKSYLDLSRKGLSIQKSLAKSLFPGRLDIMHELGSVLVAEKDSVAELRREYALYHKLGLNVRYLDHQEVEGLHGPSANFEGGILFPDDAIINSPAYSRALVDAVRGPHLRVIENSSRMEAIEDTPEGVVVKLADGTRYHSRKAVLCTGGLYLHPWLNGILRPCFSYIASIPDQREKNETGDGLGLPNSPNYFTFGFSHDWCNTNGRLRVSGEDHFSALKPPRAELRVKSLADWCYAKYPYLDKKKGYGSWYGVYSETVDYLPLVGRLREDSNVFGLLGCNAWGQTTMTYGAWMLPSLLGYGPPLSSEDQKLADFISPLRFTTTRSKQDKNTAKL